MNRKGAIVSLLVLGTVFFSESEYLIAQEHVVKKERPMDLERFQEQVFFSTVRITIQGETGVGASVGTGFLLGLPLEDREGKPRFALLLISNRHVYGNTARPIVLNIHRRKADDPNKPDLGKILTFRAKDFTDAFIGHPDPNVDLACLNVSFVADEEKKVFYKNLVPGMISDFSERDLLPGKDVWFVGYPENRFDTAHNLPLLRRGYIASIPKVNFNAREQFVIDAQVFPGSSGSPVFSELDGKFKLIGVVTETMVRNEQLQAVPTGTKLGVNQAIGLGIVIKAGVVKELIDHVREKIKSSLEKQNATPVVGIP